MAILTEFEWDDVKATKNEQKHNVSFEYASRVFLDPQRLAGKDTRKKYGESRFLVLGTIEGRLFAVAYTQRKNGITRIISARKANRREQKKYNAIHAQS